ncbi:MAG: hypothetical protein K0S82_270 [Gaiellaceae bacterium]|nr:hypothetical protein [Gaiellaceae bacterium]
MWLGLAWLLTIAVSLATPVAIGLFAARRPLLEWRQDRYWTRRGQELLAKKREAATTAAAEGTVWLEHGGTTYITENSGGFGFLIVARDRQGNDVWRMNDRPLAGLPIVDGLDELVDAGRAWLISHNCGYPLVYACRAKDLPSAGLDGDAWLRVEAWDAS